MECRPGKYKIHCQYYSGIVIDCLLGNIGLQVFNLVEACEDDTGMAGLMHQAAAEMEHDRSREMGGQTGSSGGPGKGQ